MLLQFKKNPHQTESVTPSEYLEVYHQNSFSVHSNCKITRTYLFGKQPNRDIRMLIFYMLRIKRVTTQFSAKKKHKVAKLGVGIYYNYLNVY